MHCLHWNSLKVIKQFIHDDLIHYEDRVGADIFNHAIENVFPSYIELLTANFADQIISNDPFYEINPDAHEIKRFISNKDVTIKDLVFWVSSERMSETLLWVVMNNLAIEEIDVN